MIRKHLVTFATLSIALSFLGCQSDAQKMTRGAAKEYQLRYDNCIQSVEHFRRYAGFDFVDEMGVCQCNGKMCMGEEGCNIYGECAEIKTDDNIECTDGDKICISPAMGQICKKNSEGIPKWQEPIHCTGEDVCNSELSGDYICANECSESICYINEKDHKAYYSKCVNGKLTDVLCDLPEASCMIKDYKSECGKCSNGELRYDNEPAICENGDWVKCILFADGECYKHQVCINKNNADSEVLYITDEGKQKIVKICENGCNVGHNDCEGNASQPCAHEGIKNCKVNALEVCNSDGTLNVTICANGCNEEKNDCNPETPKQDPECQPNEKQCADSIFKECDSSGKWSKTDCGDAGCNDDGCNSKEPDCTDNEKKCENSQEWFCNKGTWVGGNTCDHGCNGKSCAECQPGKTECVGDQIKTCTNGVWGNPQGCGVGEVCQNDICKCISGQNMCYAGTRSTCFGGNWISPVQCQCNDAGTDCATPSSCAPNQTRCNGDNQETCDSTGNWGNPIPCYYGCNASTLHCNACEEGKTMCVSEAGNNIKTCTNGEWIASSCGSSTKDVCSNGKCFKNDIRTCDTDKISCKDRILHTCVSGEQEIVTVCPTVCNDDHNACEVVSPTQDLSACNTDWYYKCSGPEPFELKICHEKIDNSCWESKEDIHMLTIDMTIDPLKAHLYFYCAKTEPFAKCDPPENPANFNEVLTDIQNDTCNVTASSNSVILENCNFDSALGAFSLQSYVEFIAENISSYKSKVKFNINTDNNHKIVITQFLTP